MNKGIATGAVGLALFGIASWWAIVLDMLTAHRLLWWTGIHNEIALGYLGEALLLAGMIASIVGAIYGGAKHRVALAMVAPLYIKELLEMAVFYWNKLSNY